MKKYSAIVLVTLMAAASLPGCKKSSDSTPPKDYGASIRDKTWSGAVTFAGQKTAYFSVHFRADNSLVWSESSADYPGKWSINGKKLIITHTANKITADITDDGKLMNIVTDDPGVINSCNLLENPNMSLNNTVWRGTMSAYPIELSFMPGDKIRLLTAALGTSAIGTFTYTRSASGAVIRFSNSGVLFFFGVIISGSEMKGSYGYPWEVVKQ